MVAYAVPLSIADTALCADFKPLPATGTGCGGQTLTGLVAAKTPGQQPLKTPGGQAGGGTTFPLPSQTSSPNQAVQAAPANAAKLDPNTNQPVCPDGHVMVNNVCVQSAKGCPPGTVPTKDDPNKCGYAYSSHQCRGPKFICERSHRSKPPTTDSPDSCTPEKPFPVNIVENLIDGSRYVTRACISAAEFLKVKQQYETGTGSSTNMPESSIERCKNYNVHDLQDDHFFCAFPCAGDNCNKETVPFAETVCDGGQWQPFFPGSERKKCVGGTERQVNYIKALAGDPLSVAQFSIPTWNKKVWDATLNGGNGGWRDKDPAKDLPDDLDPTVSP